VPNFQDPSKEPFLLALDRVVRRRSKEKQVSLRELAQTLGPNYRVFSYWLNGQRKFPADLVPHLCNALEDYEPLDVLEQQAGRVAYHIPKIEALPKMEDVKAIQRLVKEVGEALQSLAVTLEDGIVEQHELDKTIPELDDVIRECAHLKHWLREHHRADHSVKFREEHSEDRPIVPSPRTAGIPSQQPGVRRNRA